MTRCLWIFPLLLLITSCSSLRHRCETADEMVRCEQLNRGIIYNQSTSDLLVAAQQNGEIDNINRGFRRNGCN